MYQYTTRNYISFAGDRPLLNKYAKKSMKLSTVDMLSTFVQCRIYPLCQWSGKVSTQNHYYLTAYKFIVRDPVMACLRYQEIRGMCPSTANATRDIQNKLTEF